MVCRPNRVIRKSAPPKTPQQRAARRTKQKKRRARAANEARNAAAQLEVAKANYNAQDAHEIKIAGPVTSRNYEFQRMVDRKYIDLAGLHKHLGSLLIASAAAGVRASDSKDLPSPIVPYLGVVREPEDFELMTKTEADDMKKRTVGKEEALALALSMAKMLFKADRPYRCRLGYSSAFGTSASGVLAKTLQVSSVTSAVEWSTIILLFDEVFVHSMTLRFRPFNKNGTPCLQATGSAGTIYGTAGTGNVVGSQGLIMASYFSNAAAPSTADSLIANPNRAIKHSGEDWSYTWRNNTRFDPRGPTLSIAAADGWLGWTSVLQANDLGGLVHVRAVGDQAFGDGAHVNTIGVAEIAFDVSFRARF